LGRGRKPLTVFLDANILFSSAIGGDPFAMLWRLAQQKKVLLYSSAYCMMEARRNIERKRPEAQ